MILQDKDAALAEISKRTANGLERFHVLRGFERQDAGSPNDAQANEEEPMSTPDKNPRKSPRCFFC